MNDNEELKKELKAFSLDDLKEIQKAIERLLKWELLEVVFKNRGIDLYTLNQFINTEIYLREN